MNVIELESLTAEGLTNSLLKFLDDVGFTEYYLRRNWQAFASDGDSVMPVSYTHLRAHETRHDLV